MLDRFSVLIFDWDGTAVPDRKSPILELLAVLERALTEAKITCVVVTGTNVENLLNQGLNALSLKAKSSLFLCTNRGSEVWRFDPAGRVTSLYRRAATPEEDSSLDLAALNIQQDLANKGLKTEVIFERMNRRKIDLIPESKWASPQKSEFRELLTAVADRINSAKISGGIEILIEDAYRLSRAAGVKSPKVTSDIKHIELGLTDKSDSVKWVFTTLIQKLHFPLSQVAVIGDEFGSIGGIQGSDALLNIPELQGAKFISVGVEPEGTPSYVDHWGGGPPRFIEFLHDQVRLRMPMPSSEESFSWQVIQEGFDPSREREMETLFAIGNGYMGVRGSSDFPVPVSQPDLFLAGVYDRKVVGLPYSEIEFLTNGNRESLETEIVAFPSPFQFQLLISGERVTSAPDKLKNHKRTLHLREGYYEEEHLFEDTSGRRTRLHSRRFASLSDPHLLVQKLWILAENHSAPIEINFSSRMKEDGLPYPHLEILGPLHYRTQGSKIECAMESRLFSSSVEVDSSIYCFDPVPGQAVELYQFTSVFTGRDSSIPLIAPLHFARNHVLACTPESYEKKLHDHVSEWQKFWQNADISFDKSAELTQAQRFNIYHLRIGANHNPKNSIPAKALTGRAYEGHVFWDTEVFMLPFFLHTEPDIARSLLQYRYYTLPGARKRASEMGYKGACIAWESTVSGEDVTPHSILVSGTKEEIPIFTGIEQIHVTADVAFAVFKYWDATLDDAFLCEFGAEILIETARFWTSRVTEDTAGVYHINNVVGPDEYHHSIDDNAYTNWMAKYNLEKSVWACQYLRDKWPEAYKRLSSKVGLGEGETVLWLKIAAGLFIPKPDQRGIIEQFRGFHSLEPVILLEHERHRAPISRLFNWKAVNQLRVIKQADVLMIPFLFPDAFAKEVVAANYAYYEALTDHGSSLSPCIHAAIAAQIGRMEDAKQFWEKSLNFDLTNSMSNTGLGIHAAAIGGTWQALVFHLLGIRFMADGPKVKEALDSLDSLELSDQIGLSFLGKTTLRLIYRGKSYPIHLDGVRRNAA